MFRFLSIACFMLLSGHIADAQAQYKCTTKDGKVMYSDRPCAEDAGMGASQQQMKRGASPSAGPDPAKPAASPNTGLDKPAGLKEVGLWETSTKTLRRGVPPDSPEQSHGTYARSGGRTLKMVACDERPFNYLIDLGKCKTQFASRGGKCVIEEPGGVTTVTGNYMTAVRIEIVFKITDASKPGKVQEEEMTHEMRYLGACKPEMKRGDKFFVKENGEWITWSEFLKTGGLPK